MKAFARWQRGAFLDVERLYARAWRDGLRAAPRQVEKIIGDDGRKLKLKGFPEVKAYTDALLDTDAGQGSILNAAFAILHIPLSGRERIKSRWVRAGRPKLLAFAPYAHHVLTVEVFFHLCLATGKIASQRPSNRHDMAYLHYLPFCDVFVSGDNLHRDMAAQFLRRGQTFVPAQELKRALSEIDAHLARDNSVQTDGLIRKLKYPPLGPDNLVSKLWTTYSPRWQERMERPEPKMSPESEKRIVSEQREIMRAAESRGRIGEYQRARDVDSIVISRSVPARMGKYPVFHADFKG